MRVSHYTTLFVFLSAVSLYAQTPEDTLPEVTISSYLQSKRPLLRLPASVGYVDSAAIAQQHGQSLVPVLNTVPGVRMEERSPGSYRLSVRGSVIRSPFGVRNVKTYFDDFPLTNAGGETYLNVIDQNVLRSVEIIKGPDGSLFGANSGGVLQLSSRREGDTTNYLKASVGSGSYGLFQENVQIRKKIERSFFGFDQGWIRSDGFRRQSALDRKYFQIGNSLTYTRAATLKALFFYSDHFYETPGGLTITQSIEDPQQARPATVFTKGAEEQNSSIRNRTFFGGVSNHLQLSDKVKHVFSIFGSQTDFENPFITNYETRLEGNIGARTWIEYLDEGISWQVTANLGGEYQEMNSHIENHDNNGGVRDSVQAVDDITARTGFVFARFNAAYLDRLQIEISASYNLNASSFQRMLPLPLEPQTTALQGQVMPRWATSYFFFKRFALRAIVSRGYSPPSLQESRASDNTINTELQPEHGWNLEAGIRLRTNDDRLWWDASAFYFSLEDAIVRKVNAQGQEFFENAGGTDQKGVESVVRYHLLKKKATGFLRQAVLGNSCTFSNFIFSKGVFKGNALTGVPGQVIVSFIDLKFGGGFYWFIQHNYTSELPLNDDNSEWATSYNLVTSKIGWLWHFRKFDVDVNTGADNILGEVYSLGNDLNAVGRRYYNPAPGLTYFWRLGFTF